MITYTHFPPEGKGERSVRQLTEDQAARGIGQRVLSGWPVTVLHFKDRSGTPSYALWFTSVGRVWALYSEGSES